MKKILLIDDRRDEQAVLFRQYEIGLHQYEDYLDNLSGEESIAFFANFNINNVSLLKYKVWIIHQTLFDKLKGMQRKTERFCKQNHIQLVLFSGYISTIMISPKIGVLKLSRDDLYKNLKNFLDYNKDGEAPLEMLGFGNDWQVRLLSNVEDTIEKFLVTSERTISMELFKSKINNFDSAVKILGNDDYVNLANEVDKEVIVSLLREIQEMIMKQTEL